ncbi:hypothetical protein DFH09DRAFT_1393209 [Mycena vulgaris]|nr:hypothetical protein DFH09DRAFT_1393209 [Mycena vulgaris]
MNFIKLAILEIPPRSGRRSSQIPIFSFYKAKRTASRGRSSFSAAALPENGAPGLSRAARDAARVTAAMLRLPAVFLPLPWERVEACFEARNGTAWRVRVANVLLDRCKGLTKRQNQGSARHARYVLGARLPVCFFMVVSVFILSHQIAVVMPVFAQCLESLPTLDTLDILHLKSTCEDTVADGFEHIELPGVSCMRDYLP